MENRKKSCSGPEHFLDVCVVEDEPRESIEATLASLLGAAKSLTTSLKEVQADNQQLRALLTNQSPIKEVPVSSTSTGRAKASGACAQRKTCHNKPIDASLSLGWQIPAIVTRTTTRLSRPHTSAPKTKSASHGGVSLYNPGRSENYVYKVLYPQLWPHSFLSLTNARRDMMT